jgi:trehalose 6-phosphate synthase
LSRSPTGSPFGGPQAGGALPTGGSGAIEELPTALPCNPFDLEGLAGTIDLSLELPAEDRRRRLERMAATVRRHDVHAWAKRELATLGTV